MLCSHSFPGHLYERHDSTRRISSTVTQTGSGKDSAKELTTYWGPDHPGSLHTTGVFLSDGRRRHKTNRFPDGSVHEFRRGLDVSDLVVRVARYRPHTSLGPEGHGSPPESHSREDRDEVGVVGRGTVPSTLPTHPTREEVEFPSRDGPDSGDPIGTG